jgi:hypothetical protein
VDSITISWYVLFQLKRLVDEELLESCLPEGSPYGLRRRSHSELPAELCSMAFERNEFCSKCKTLHTVECLYRYRQGHVHPSQLLRGVPFGTAIAPFY